MKNPSLVRKLLVIDQKIKTLMHHVKGNALEKKPATDDFTGCKGNSLPVIYASL